MWYCYPTLEHSGLQLIHLIAMPTPRRHCQNRPPLCPLCGERKDLSPVTGADDRDYLLCPTCHLIFVTAADLPTADQERERYQLHRNSIEDSGYVRFLKSVLSPLLPQLSPEMRGLDYGCGPTPVLAEIMARRNFRCDIYDPFFFPNTLSPPTILFSPPSVSNIFTTPPGNNPYLLTAGACGLAWHHDRILAVTTNLCRLALCRDTTHVVFYHQSTLHFMTTLFPLTLRHCDNHRLALFQKR